LAFRSTIFTVKTRTVTVTIIRMVLVIEGIIVKRTNSFNYYPISLLGEVESEVGYCFVEVEEPPKSCCNCYRCSFLRVNSLATVISWAVAWFVSHRGFVGFNPVESKAASPVVIINLFLWLGFKLVIIASKQNLTTSMS